MAEQFPKHIEHVADEPFLGRDEELRRFRDALSDLRQGRAKDDPPYVFHLYGEAGMGKSRLARELKRIADEDKTHAGKQAPYSSTSLRGFVASDLRLLRHTLYTFLFHKKIQTLWLDWEAEQKLDPQLKVLRHQIRAEDVLDRVYIALTGAKPGLNCDAYREAQLETDEAYQEGVKVLSSVEESERDRPRRQAVLGGVIWGLRVAANVAGVPIPGGWEGEAADAMEPVVTEAIEEAREILRSRMDPGQLRRFLSPHEFLAKALGECLKRAAQEGPLIVFFDTYEIVDRADVVLRLVIHAAGPNVAWVIAGQNNLVDTRRGRQGILGYKGEEPNLRVIAWKLGEFSVANVAEYFRSVVPNKDFTDEKAKRVHTAVWGIPLAVRLAAAIWEAGGSLDAVLKDLSDEPEREHMVNELMKQTLRHCIADADLRAIYALAILRRHDTAALTAMLRPEEGLFDLPTRIEELQRNYPFVHTASGHLHDKVQGFLKEYLMADVRRLGDDRVANLCQGAVNATHVRLSELEQDLASLAERCRHADWQEAALDLAYYTFWLAEPEAWRWVAPRLVEALAYRKQLATALLTVCRDCRPCLSKEGERRLEQLARDEYDGMLRPSSFRFFRFEFWPLNTDALQVLEEFRRIGWLDGDGEAERKGILDWIWALHLLKEENPDKAHTKLREMERNLSPLPEALQALLAEAFEDVGDSLGFSTRGAARGSREAISAYRRAIELGRNSVRNYRRLSRVQGSLGDYTAAHSSLERALAIDQSDEDTISALGDLLAVEQRYPEAIDAYKRAIRLNQKDADAYLGLAQMYYRQGNYEEARDKFQAVLELDPYTRAKALAHRGLGDVYDDLGRYEEACDEYEAGIALWDDSLSLHNNLGTLLVKMGHYEKAEENFETRIRLSPHDALPANLYLGVLHLIRGGRAVARGHFQTALDIAQSPIARLLLPLEGVAYYRAFASLCLEDDETRWLPLFETVLDSPYVQRVDLDESLVIIDLLDRTSQPPMGLGKMKQMTEDARRQRGWD